KNMKPKIIILMFSGLLAGSVAVSGQNNPAADSAAATNAAAATTTSTNVTVDATATAAPATETLEVTKPAAVTNSPVIPLIVMDESPLTDAVKNLARQAGINSMLDPKIAYGQPDATGKPPPQPSVSIRWENITAEQALLALLNNYGLQLVDDPKTKIS